MNIILLSQSLGFGIFVSALLAIAVLIVASRLRLRPVRKEVLVPIPACVSTRRNVNPAPPHRPPINLSSSQSFINSLIDDTLWEEEVQPDGRMATFLSEERE